MHFFSWFFNRIDCAYHHIFCILQTELRLSLQFNSFVADAFMKSVFAPLLSLCVIINLGLFYLFYWKYLNYAARGVIGATFVYAFIVFIIKIFY
jgi:hypothetical protein